MLDPTFVLISAPACISPREPFPPPLVFQLATRGDGYGTKGFDVRIGQRPLMTMRGTSYNVPAGVTHAGMLSRGTAAAREPVRDVH